MSVDDTLLDLSRRLGAVLQSRGWILASAESCTGGWIAETVTAVPGSSAWFDTGFVTYSNSAKVRLLGVPETLLAQHGAVAPPIVEAMVAGALANSSANVAVAVSGIAGPGGGTVDKPVGTVCLAWAWPGRAVFSTRCRFEGNRTTVRRQTVIHALEKILYK